MISTVEDPATRLCPEMQSGGFSRVNETIEFYVRVGALLGEIGPEAVVLDYAAGRGSLLDDPVPFSRELRRLQGRAGRVVGIDINDAVLRNPSLDEAHVVPLGERLPFDDMSVDLVISDSTFEHAAG